MHSLDSLQNDGPERVGPFALRAEAAYRAWRERKLERYPARAEDLIVEIGDLRNPTAAERGEILRCCAKANMAIYAARTPRAVDKDAIRDFGRHFGLLRLDGNLCADEDSISSLRVMEGGRHSGYIPYSNRPLSWHTDGYYNDAQRRIRAFIIHCAAPAANGGANAVLDHEIAYICLRDADPRHIEALMQPDVMTIPPNEEGGEQLRGEQTGPVFSVDPSDGYLHMRYTARKRNIRWKPTPATMAAVSALETLLAGDNPYVFRHRLEAGQGIICNNVLHNRAGFQDGSEPESQRLMYRARYYDRIA